MSDFEEIDKVAKALEAAKKKSKFVKGICFTQLYLCKTDAVFMPLSHDKGGVREVVVFVFLSGLAFFEKGDKIQHVWAFIIFICGKEKVLWKK